MGLNLLNNILTSLPFKNQLGRDCVESTSTAGSMGRPRNRASK